MSSRTSGHKHCRVDKEYCRVEKCILLGRLSKFSHGVQSRVPSNQLSSRTSRTSGHKHCRVVRVDTSIVELYEWTQALSSRQRILSSGKCISLGRVRTLKDVVVSRSPSNQLSSRTSRTSCLQRAIIGVRFGDRPPA